ncbi:isopeptide-forming domain-containing fimbrial protein [Pseudoblastomonas halimionae]|uniref:DUF11 domain-containing protein n=1 Tax=Alteriqipengyuania halimionae TaxID=1926630 RepID=A0A6I4TZQ4_9SPHN|nr:isopeptide-forming domain-containing fimbrial protein [Alteriqipengyuania halimionae]MXP09118.1 DUF11 domain-containing protein [Alteriqipengyuania halimionae]
MKYLAAAFLTALLLVTAAPLQAQTITNTARASWQQGGITQATSSNEVGIEVVDFAAEITTYHPSRHADRTISVKRSSCAGEIIPFSSADAAPPTEMPLQRSAIIKVGELLVFTIVAPQGNRNPDARDAILVTITSAGGDEETLTIYETGNDTGEFAGAIQTVGIPPQPVSGDCRLSVHAGETVSVELKNSDGRAMVRASVSVLADPFGIVFDSRTGDPVDGTRITLFDSATGLPATVFAPDGVTPWPSTIFTGQTILDASGNAYPLDTGEYWFPLVPVGTYRLELEPPAPYSAPSKRAAEEMADLRRPNGVPFTLVDASFGADIPLLTLEPVRIDIPVDRPIVDLALEKRASRQVALPGDAVFYTVTARNPDTIAAKRNVVLVDTPSPWLRLRPDSILIDGASAPDQVNVSADGRRLTIRFEEIAAGASHVVRYAMVVRGDAPPGEAQNRVEATDSEGETIATGASVRIERDTLGSRMTIIGRISAGACSLDGDRPGIPGVRVVMEDGSFALTDEDGRYHFEGVMPGTHVIQVQRQTLPEGGRFMDCARSTASAGSPGSRFVRGQGGSLAVADFHAALPEGWEAPVIAEAAEQAPVRDAEAAGAEIDWLSYGDGEPAFLFPELGHNPRAPSVRVAIRHEKDQTVELAADGRQVDAVSYDGAQAAADGSFAVSVWRGLPLQGESTLFRAVVRNSDGSVAAELERVVDFAAAPVRAEVIAERSRLIADGATNPVIAVRLTDRKGCPVRAGVSGSVTLNAPYESARAIAQYQSQQLVGGGSVSPTWTIEGDDGIALIELAPTMVSGPLKLEFAFTQGKTTRHQELDSWVVPGDQEWTLVGLVEGSIGARSVADNMERSGRFDSDLGDDARVAFYAKGRVLGKFLITAAYDSAKQRDEEQLTGAIDPKAYYTVFADRSVRRFDAASRDKLYIRIETDTFYAISGDIVTGFDQTELARYNRSVTGVKAEGRFGALHVQGFAAETETRYRRDEIQGNGLSGPYALSSRALVANSETVTIEVRDRFRSELVLERRELERFVDYDIDLLSGTISFKQPVLSRDFALNPQFIVVEYEVDALTGSDEWNAGLRADVTVAKGAVRIGATAITDKGDDARTELIAADVRARVGTATELRAEFAASRTDGTTSNAWHLEAAHRSGAIDVLAYARRIDAGFGVDQQNVAERGRRKIGFDARYTVSDEISVTGSAWRDDSLIDDARRNAVQVQAGWRGRSTDLRLGISHFADRTADGVEGSSTVLEGGVNQRLLGGRLEIGATSSMALANTDSIDLPTRHRFDARYAISNAVRAVATYEIAEGDLISARTLKGGFEFTPWAGGRMLTTLGQQDIAGYGKRSFAAYGLAQSFAITESFTVDATIDGNLTLGGVDASRVINPDQPVASGGQVGQGGTLFEDFTAITLGAGWRKDRWAATMRGEWRDGELEDRVGATGGLIRQLGEGSVVGSGFTWTHAHGLNGSESSIVDGSIAAAYRPDSSPFALLAKLEYRSDEVTGAVAGEIGATGRTTITGDGTSRRLIASLSTNWSPRSREETETGAYESFLQRTEIGVFVAGRYNADSFEGTEIEGFTALGGVDARIGLGERFEIGGRASVRSNLADGATDFSFGPEVGFSPVDNVLVSVGYNVKGFRDRDFSAARYTDDGVYAAVRMKLDADTFGFLGLGR